MAVKLKKVESILDVIGLFAIYNSNGTCYVRFAVDGVRESMPILDKKFAEFAKQRCAEKGLQVPSDEAIEAEVYWHAGKSRPKKQHRDATTPPQSLEISDDNAT